MIYEEPPRLSLEKIREAISSQDPKRAGVALISASLYLNDWRLAQELCLGALSSKHNNIKRCAIIGFMHIVRINNNLDVREVYREIDERLEKDSDLWGYVEDLKDDVATFFGKSVEDANSQTKQ